ncbi:hypothetical protein PseudUWO310_11810 [Pseudanabaena sp. UWO310]|nr:hypothetical protein PseudUWO310_11810 [Pseudanabaena sp. UWO310]
MAQSANLLLLFFVIIPIISISTAIGRKGWKNRKLGLVAIVVAIVSIYFDYLIGLLSNRVKQSTSRL